MEDRSDEGVYVKDGSQSAPISLPLQSTTTYN